MNNDEFINLCNFSVYGQRDVVEKIKEDYKLKSPANIKAALNEAAWQGYLKGLADGKSLNQEK